MNLGFSNWLIWIHARNFNICWSSPHISGNSHPLKVYAENSSKSLEFRVDIGIIQQDQSEHIWHWKTKQEFEVSERNCQKLKVYDVKSCRVRVSQISRCFSQIAKRNCVCAHAASCRENLCGSFESCCLPWEKISISVECWRWNLFAHCF